MQQHTLIQGTPEWKAHRAQHFNAADAAAMLGESPNESRQQLMHRLHTGMEREFGEFVEENILADGHRTEALARPLAEEIIGEELYPIVGTSGKLSASYDGLTMLLNDGWEHKRLNNRLRGAFTAIEATDTLDNGAAGAMLPIDYRVQMEHQLAVAEDEGCERILFMASEWDADGNLIEERHCWYYPDPALRARVLAGWEQFEADLCAYVPPEVTPVKPVGKTMESLPALLVKIEGKVIASNLAEYKKHAVEVFQSIKTDLETDQDFADAETGAQWCRDVAKRIGAAKEHALGQTADIDALLRTLSDIEDAANSKGLQLEKLVKARKDEIRAEIITNAKNALSAHIAALNERLGKRYMPPVAADFAAAAKGKRSVQTTRDAVDHVLLTAKLDANATADRIHANMKALAEADHEALFPDVAQLVLKQADDLAAVINSRISKFEADEAKKKAEAEERQHAAEAAAQAALARAAAPSPVAPPPIAPEPAQPARAPMPYSVFGRTAAAPAPAMPAQPVAAPKLDTTPTLALGAIKDRLGFALTADFLAGLGFEATPAPKGSGKLFSEAQFAGICDALIERIMNAREAVVA